MSDVSLVDGHIEDPKMSDEEIMKALEKALTDIDAPVGEHWGCGFLTTQNIKDVLGLLKRKDAEIDIILRKKEKLRDLVAEQQAEIERLKQLIAE